MKGPVSSEELGITLEAATTDDLNALIREQFKTVVPQAFVRDVQQDFQNFYLPIESGRFRSVFEGVRNPETDEILEAQVQRAGACVCMH